MQGLFARVGSGDPVRVLRLFHNNYTGYCCIHLLCITTYNLSLPRLSANYYGLPTTVQLRAAHKNRCSLVGVSRSTAVRYCTVPAWNGILLGPFTLLDFYFSLTFFAKTKSKVYDRKLEYVIKSTSIIFLSLLVVYETSMTNLKNLCFSRMVDFYFEIVKRVTRNKKNLSRKFSNPSSTYCLHGKFSVDLFHVCLEQMRLSKLALDLIR